MGRKRGLFNIPANYEPLIAAPFDARQRVDYKADLYEADTWNKTGDGKIYLYNGLLVSVTEDTATNNGLYMLKDALRYNFATAWEKIGGGSAEGQIIFGTRYEFPTVGEIDRLYVAKDEYKAYIWDGEKYVVIAGNEKIIDAGGADAVYD